MRQIASAFLICFLWSSSATKSQTIKSVGSTNNEVKQTLGLFKNEPGAFAGYTLFQPRHNSSTFLIDMDGKKVHEWKNDQRVENAKLLDNGLLLRMVNIRHPDWLTTPGPHGKVQLVDWEGKVQWEFEYVDETKVLHHDVVPMPNGNFLLSSFKKVSKQEAVAAGRKENTIRGYLLVEKLIEVKPTGKSGGEVVWEWCVWDHLIQEYDKTKENYGKVSDHPELFHVNHFRRPMPDWNHVSGLDYNAERDEILLTFHGNDEIIIIDHSTTTEEAASHSGGRHGKGGDIIYRWGNPKAYENGRDQDRHFWVLHNAHYIPKGLKDEGRIMVLNNQYGGSNSFVELIDIPTNSDGTYTIPTKKDPTGAATFEIVYKDFHTRNMGGMQRLPNGNTLIDVAVKGQFIEVTPEGDKVWDYVNPIIHDGALAQGDEIPPNFSGDLLNEVFRVTRIPKDHPALEGKNLKPMGTLELVPGARDDNPPVTPKAPPGVMMLPPQDNRPPSQRFQGQRPQQGQGFQGQRPQQGQRSVNQQMDLSTLNLSKEQKKDVSKVLRKYGAERQKTRQANQGNRSEMIQQMIAIGEKQNAEVKEILTEDQFDQYMKLIIKQRDGRRRN